ncbi:hypothetical protein [Ferruginibacter sp.]
MKNDFFDKAIKEKALQHQAAVPADAWSNIENNKRKRRAGAWWWLAGILVAIGLGLFGVYEYSRHTVNAGAGAIAAAGQTRAEMNKKETTTAGTTTTNNALNNQLQEPDTVQMPAGRNVTNREQLQDAGSIKKEDNVKPADNNAAPVLPVNKKDIVKTNSNLSTQKRDSNKKGIRNIPADDERTAAFNKERNDYYTSPGDMDKQAIPKRRERNGKSKTNIAIKGAAATETMEATAINETTTQWVDKIESIPGDITAIKTDSSINVHPAIKLENGKAGLKETAAGVTENADKKAVKKKSLWIDISAMPFAAVQKMDNASTISRTTITPTGKAEFTADQIKNNVDPAVSYTITLRKNIGKNWLIGTGIQYAKIKEAIRLSGKEVNTNYTVLKRLAPGGNALIDDTIATVTTGNRTIKARNSYDFISLPLMVQYKLTEKPTWSLLLNGGICFNINTVYKNSIEGNLVANNTASNNTATKNSKTTIDFFAGMRLTKKLDKNWQFFAEPTLQLNLVKYNMPGMIEYKNIHRAGVSLGFTYTLHY